MRQSRIRTMVESGTYRVLLPTKSCWCIPSCHLHMPVHLLQIYIGVRQRATCRLHLHNADAHAAATGDHGTSHLSVVDSHRNAVSFTTTINTSFGSKLLSKSTGTSVSR